MFYFSINYAPEFLRSLPPLSSFLKMEAAGSLEILKPHGFMPHIYLEGSYFSCAEIKNVWSYASTIPYTYSRYGALHINCECGLFLYFFPPCCNV